MAKQLNSYQVNLEFTADSKAAEQQLQSLQNQLTSLINSSAVAGSNFGLTKELQNGVNAAAQLKVKLEEATDVNTGKLDLTKFSQSLSRSNIQLKDYANSLSELGPEGAEAFMSLARSISMADAPLFKVKGLLGELFVTLKNTARWQISSSILHEFMGAVSAAYGYAQDLNESLNNIRIVTGQSSEQMAKFAGEANKAAKALSTTTTKYTDAALIYYQQGLDDEQVKERTDITIKMANVARESADIVSDQMTAVWNNFYDGSQSLEHYADAMVRLGADTASSTDEIAGGLEKFAAVADTIGLSFDNAAAALATITATTRQSEDVVGTALKTIFARVQGLKLGETLDDGTTLNQYSQALANVGVDIKDTNGELKDMDDILDELGQKWDSISKAQQVALAQQVAGVRQYTQLIALMDNFDYYQENLQRAQNADGSLDKQADIYAESWEAASKRLRASLEAVFSDILNDEFFIDITDGLSKIVDGVDWLMDRLGGLKGVLAVISTLVFKLMGNQIANKLRDAGDSLSLLTASGREKVNNRKKEALNAAMGVTVDDGTNFGALRGDNMKQEITLQNTLLENEGKISDEEKKIYSLRLDSIRAMQKQTEEQAKNLDLLQDEEDSVKQSLMYRQRQKIARGETGIDEEEYRKAVSNYTMYNEAYGRVSYSQRRMSTSEKAISSFKNIGDVKRFINQYLSEMQGVANIETKNSNEKSAATEAFRPFLNSLKEFDKTTTDLQGEDKLKKFFTSINENIGEGKTNLELFIEGFEELKRVIVETAEASVQDPWLESDKETGKDFDQLSESARQAGNAAEGLNDSINHVNEGAEKLGEDIQEPKEQIEDWATTLTEVGSSLSQVAMGIGAVNSIIDTLKEGELDLNSIMDILFSLGMILPIITNLLKENALKSSAAALGQLAFGKAALTASGEVLTFGAALKAALPLLSAIAVATAVVVAVISELVVTSKEAQEKISEATSAYEEQKNALESLNDELKTTKDRIEELNNQDTLSITDKEELANLQKQQKLLERQVELQERLTKAQQRTQAKTIEDNYKKANNTLINGPQYGKGANGQSQTADEWYNERIEEGKGDIYFNLYQDRLKKEAEIRDQWLSDNSEAIQQAESDYQSYMDAVAAGAIDFNLDEIANLTEIITNVRKAIYSDGEYQETFLEPLLDDATFTNISDSIYNALSSDGGIEDAAALISESFKNQLAMAGVSVDEFLTYLNDKVSETKNNIQNQFQGDNSDFFNSLTSEDWNILTTINIKNFDTLEEVKEFLDNYKVNSVKVDVYGMDELNEVLDKINKSQSAMETALKSYKDQKGYLTMDQVEALISADESYANYIIKVGDAYKLTNGALQDFLKSEDQEELLLDAQIESIKKKNEVNTDYVSNYISMYDELINETKFDPEKYSFTNESDAQLFKERTQALKDVSEQYQKGEKTVSEYFDGINDRVKNIRSGFSTLDDEINDDISTTDLYEKTLVAATGSIANGFTDLNKQLRSGAINMDDYYKGVVSGLRALITTQSKLNKNVIQDAKTGTWKIKDGIDEITVGTEEWGKAQDAVNSLNTWQKQLEGAEAVSGAVDLFTEHYDYLIEHANANGQINFDVKTNFDVASAEFQSFQQDLFDSLGELEKTAPEKFANIANSMAAKYTELADGTAITAEKLVAFTQDNAKKVSTLSNSLMDETLSSVSSASQAAGNILSSLGSLIENFDYTISFVPNDSGNTKFNLIKYLMGDGKEGLPEISYKITGSSDNSNVKNFVQSLKDAGDYFSTREDNGNPATNRLGIENFGWTNKNPNGVLDPNSIKTDNIRDKAKEKEIERYHEILRYIQYQEEALNRLGKAKDKAYGKDKIKYIEDEIKANQKLYQTEQELYNLILADVSKDQKEVQTQFGGKAKFNAETYELDNYTELYTSMTTDKQKKALEQYEKTLDLLQKYQSSLDEINTTVKTLHYEKLTYTLELSLKVDENETKKLEYYFDKLSNNIYKAAEAFSYLQDQFNPAINSLKDYENFYDTLQYNKDNITSEDYIDGLQESYDGLMDNLSALKDLDDQMMEYYGNTLDLANEELSKYTTHMENLTSALEHYSSIITLLGKDKDYRRVLEVLNGVADTKKNNFEVSKDWYEVLKGEKEEAARALANARDDAEREMLKANFEAIVEKFDEAYEQMLSDAEEYGNALKEILTQTIQESADAMEKEMSSISFTVGDKQFDISGWDAVSDALDRMSSYQDEYLDKVNQTYEMNKLINNVNKAIDNTTNQGAKVRYAQFNKELEQLKEKDQLSKLELEIAQAKYKVLEAQIALEEAQNAKTTVRLQRDSEGNFGYVYTADQNKLDDAQQQLDDAENDLYNIRLDATNKYGQQKLQYERELAEKLAELDEKAANDALYREGSYQQERQAVIEQYTNLILSMGDQFNIAQEEDLRVAQNAWVNNFDIIKKNGNEWQESIQNNTDKINEAFADWESRTDIITDLIGEDFEDTREKVKEVTDESDNLRKQLKDELIPTLKEETTSVQKATTAWANQRGTLLSTIDYYERLADSIREAIAAQSKFSGSDYNEDVDYSELMAKAYAENRMDDYERYKKLRDEKMSKNNDTTNVSTSRLDALNKRGYVLGSGELAGYSSYTDIPESWWKSHGFATGGYTGNWDGAGKLAFLHQKELVLNAEDTENMLKTIEIVRTIAKSIDLNSNMMAQGLGILNPTTIAKEIFGQLEQDVHIEANFPNVTNHSEIEEAFNNLINISSQYANRKI